MVTVRRIPRDQFGFFKYIKQAGHVPLHLADAPIIVLTVNYVAEWQVGPCVHCELLRVPSLSYPRLWVNMEI